MASYSVTLHVQRLVNAKRSPEHIEVTRLNVHAGSMAIAARKTITAREGYRPGGKGERLIIEVERMD